MQNRSQFPAVLLLAAVMIAGGGCRFQRDHSLSMAAYRKMGVPDCSKPWSKDEYGQGLSVLRNQRLYGSLNMPRKYSRKSGILFRRLVSEENMSFLADTALSLAEKAYRIQHFSNFQKGMIGLYTQKVNDLRYYRDELADLYLFGLRVQDHMLALSDELSRSEIAMERDLNAHSSFVVQDYVDMTMKILKEQLTTGIYRQKDMNRLSAALTGSLEANWKLIGPADRQKITAAVQAVVNQSRSRFILNNYRHFLEFSR